MTVTNEVAAIQERQIQVGDHHIEMVMVKEPNGHQSIGNCYRFKTLPSPILILSFPQLYSSSLAFLPLGSSS
jgi:hypothetical protein